MNAISRYPVPQLNDLPDDIRSRILEVQAKAGFVPNVFLVGWAPRRPGILPGRDGKGSRRRANRAGDA